MEAGSVCIPWAKLELGEVRFLATKVLFSLQMVICTSLGICERLEIVNVQYLVLYLVQ